jgi:hypothetical protein
MIFWIKSLLQAKFKLMIKSQAQIFFSQAVILVKVLEFLNQGKPFSKNIIWKIKYKKLMSSQMIWSTNYTIKLLKMENHRKEIFQKRSKVKWLLRLIENNRLSKQLQKLVSKHNLDFSGMRMIKNYKKLKKIICNSKKKNIKSWKISQCSS